MTRKPATEAPVNGGRNYNGPKVAKFLIGAYIDGKVWHLDVSSSPPRAVVGSKGWDVRPLKRLVWGNSLIGFCVKILNSTIVIGFYYGFRTTFSIGPSYLFLLRGQILGKGSKTKISATTGFAHYLGRTPLPYYYIEEMMRYDDRDLEEVKATIDWEKEETNEEEEDITVYLSDKKENTFNKKLVPLEKSLVTTFFDYQKWNRPLRYIKNDHFERVVRDENSQFFSRKLYSEINEISKEVPRWSYDLVDELEVLMDASPKESQIRSPKAVCIVHFNSKTNYNDNQNSAEPDRNTEFVVVHYSREPDYC
ncbi:hypothetical protein RYX36_032255 [Vicia faba]